MQKLETNKEKIKAVADILSLGAVLQYVSFRFLQSTMFRFYYSDSYKIFTMILLIVFGSFRWVIISVEKWKQGSKARKRYIYQCILSIALALPFIYVGWKQDYKILIFLPICCMCLYDMEPEKILKAFALTVGILLAATVLCALSNTVRNLTFCLDNGNVIGAFGIVNTTDFATYFTFILLASWCGIHVCSWKSNIAVALITIIVSYIVWQITDSRTVLYSGALIALFAIWDAINNTTLRTRKTIQNVNRVSKAFIISVFPVLGLLFMFSVFRFGAGDIWAEKLNKIVSDRLSTTWTGLVNYGIHPFGSLIENMRGNGGSVFHYVWSSSYGYLDSAYAMVIIRYGWVITGIVAGLWIWMTLRAFRCGKDRIAYAMAIMAFHAISEARIWDVNYNIFLIMPFCALRIESKEKTIRVKEKNNIFPVLTVVMLLVIGCIAMPRILSWLRTIFALMGWNDGTASLGSLVVCIILGLVIYLLWKTINQFLRERNTKNACIITGTIVVIIVFVLIGNGVINHGIIERSNRLKTEIPIIRQVQSVAEKPVYAAEAEEMYYREVGGFSNHVFSNEELYRTPQGTLFTDKNVEAMTTTWSGAKYTQISEWSGLYSYDQNVIDKLSSMGYVWTPFFNGTRSCNLKDTAIFNDLEAEDHLTLCGPVRIVTTNMELDQNAGEYEVAFRISASDLTLEGDAVILEVLGESGETIIWKESLSSADFDSTGCCCRTIVYRIGHVPKVSFAITVNENTSIVLEDISWKRIT